VVPEMPTGTEGASLVREIPFTEGRVEPMKEFVSGYDVKNVKA
jgi:hypothetical protein